MEYFTGIILAVVIILSARLSAFEKNKLFYPSVLIIIALIYVLFGFIDGRPQVILSEILFAIFFTILAITGLKKNFLAVALGIAAHGIFDAVHPVLLENHGVPGFYPEFCMTVDIVLGVYLGFIYFTDSKEFN